MKSGSLRVLEDASARRGKIRARDPCCVAPCLSSEKPSLVLRALLALAKELEVSCKLGREAIVIGERGIEAQHSRRCVTLKMTTTRGLSLWCS